MEKNRKRGLGRGLDALISMDDVMIGGSSSINEVELSKITPNPEQPRQDFDKEALEALAQSIAEVGVIQPITLRKMEDDTYQIIAGERRYRAAVLANLSTIPAYIRTASDENMLEMALIENVQREDLNAMEVAITYQNLIEQYKLTQEKLSSRVGKNRSTITNYLRLLKLPAEVQLGLKNKQIDMGHARALLAIDSPADQLKIYNLIQEQGLSVRMVEKLAKDLADGNEIKQSPIKRLPKKIKLPEEYLILRGQLSNSIGREVQCTCEEGGSGRISIPFSSGEDLERLVSLFETLKEN